MTKTCTCCHRELSVEEFHRNKTKKDGLATVCKACNKAYFSKYYAKNRDYHIKAVNARKARLYRKPRLSPEAAFWIQVEKQPNDGCWLWRGALDSQGGYGAYCWKGKKTLAHRLSWMLTYGDIPPGMCICHECDVPACVRPDHLFCGTQQDNQRDKLEKGRQSRGENNGRAKLTEGFVIEIKRLAAQGRTASQLARTFNVDPSTIRLIIKGKIWKDLP